MSTSSFIAKKEKKFQNSFIQRRISTIPEILTYLDNCYTINLISNKQDTRQHMVQNRMTFILYNNRIKNQKKKWINFIAEEPRTTVTAPPRITVRTTTARTRQPFLPPRVRPTTISTTTTTTTTPVPPRRVASTAELPATVRETIARKPNVGLQRPAPPPSPPLNDDSSDHPQDNEISGSGVDNAQVGIGTGVPEPSGPYRVDNADHTSNTHQAKLNLGAVIALGVFGGFVFLAAVITTVVILIRR